MAKKYTTEMSFSCERCLPRGRVASPFPSRRPDQLRGQAGQQAAHRHVDQLCQTWVGSFQHKEECEDFFFRNPSPDSGLWQTWNEGGEYLEIGHSHFKTFIPMYLFPDGSPHMTLSAKMVERMEFWRSICGLDGCPSGSGL